jgi:hypothetical protein
MLALAPPCHLAQHQNLVPQPHVPEVQVCEQEHELQAQLPTTYETRKLFSCVLLFALFIFTACLVTYGLNFFK